VFRVTFPSFLPFLTETDCFRLATSYWCNAEHFNVMVKHRGHKIKGDALSLSVTDELLDAAMRSGSTAEKIEAMLLQRRRDRVGAGGHSESGGEEARYWKSGKLTFAHSKDEAAFFRRNLKHRLWNHEVLAAVFVRNGWLTPDLSERALSSFASTIYPRVMESTAPRRKNSGWIDMNEAFLTTFFADHFGLDGVPEMIGSRKMKKEETTRPYHLSEATLKRWCSLIELLAARGAKGAEDEFLAIAPLRYALQIGRRTFNVISASHEQRNRCLIPEQWQSITVPDDIWDVLMGYL